MFYVNNDRKQICESNKIQFPVLEELLNHLLSGNTYSEANFELINKVLKIYQKVTRMDLDEYTRD